jgi:copper ion binding protein
MELVLSIDGMSCEHCAASIKAAVQKLNGINEISVSLKNKTASISFSEALLSKGQIIRVIEELGYKINR